MTVLYRGVSTPRSGINTTFAGFPWTWGANTGVVGDLGIGYLLMRPHQYYAYPPAGWAFMGGVKPGTLSTSTHLMVFCKVHTGTEPAIAIPTYPANTFPSPVTGVSHGYQKDTGAEWVASAAFGADTDATTTNLSVTPASIPRFTTGDHGLIIIGMTNTNAVVSGISFSIPGCTLSSLVQSVSANGIGSGGTLAAWTFTIVSGTSTGDAASFTATTDVAANSYVPFSLVRIGEALGGEKVLAPIAPIDVTSPAFNAWPKDAKTSTVTVTSPVGVRSFSNVSAATIAVSSPPISSTYTTTYGNMSASLALTTSSSGTLRALEPAAAASEGTTAPVEVQIWKPDNTQMLAVADGRMKMQWLDDMNDSGSGSFDLSRWDPKATTQNLALFNLVRFVYAGRTRFASRIEERHLTVSGSGDHEAQIWQIQGRGVLAMLADAVLYPEYGINEFTRKERSFFYGSKEGAWYVASEWFQPRGLPRSAVPADHPWHGHPADWPDPDAQWIWPSDPNTLSNPGTVWFRSKFVLSSSATVTVYASADDQVTLFVDGFPALATVSGEKHSFRAAPKFAIRMTAGEHLIAAEVMNSDATLEEVQPIVTSNEVRPTYATDSNKPYVGKGYTDGGHPYVNANGSVADRGPGQHAFDGDPNSYWMSVGNYLGWSSAYEWVEGTFPSQPVTAIRVSLHGGPYTVYISLKSGGGGWNGDATVPYRARSVDAGTAIRYVREVRVGVNENITVNIPAQTADRIRITLKADWDSGVWQYRWRGAVKDVVITSESREGSYVRGGNYAGLLVTVATTDDSGAVTGIIHRSQPEGWLCKTGERPGWRPAHILTQIVAEAKSRNVLGVLPLKLGFTNDVDSYGVPWTMARKDIKYTIGDNYLSIVKKLVEDSLLDVWIEPDTLMLHAAPKRGEDKTIPPIQVILRPGQSLTDFAVDSNRPNATRLVVESELGWMEVADFEPEAAYGRVEGFVSLGNALSTQEARTTAINELNRFALESYDTTVRTTDVLGPRPYLEFNVGDRILIPLGVGSETEFGINRVLSFKISEGDAGELDVTVEADREFDAKDLGI
jgi:hypothetical protein